MLPFFMFTLSLEGFRPRPTLPHPSGIPRQDRPTRASHSIFDCRQSTSLFSNYYALFCTANNPNSFRFIFFRTLCTKHPGWGYPTFANSLFSPLDQLVTRHSFTPSIEGAHATKPFRSNTYKKTGGRSAPNLAWGGFQELAEVGGHLIGRRD